MGGQNGTEVTSVEIDRVRKFYIPYAVRTAILYFCVTEMSVTDPMYQFSLQWYQALATSLSSQVGPFSKLAFLHC